MEAIINKYGLKEGLIIREGQIINWPYDEDEPTSSELETIIGEYELATDYIEKRVAEYPDVEDQLDMIYKDQINGTSTFAEAILEIKTKYPKPE